MKATIRQFILVARNYPVATASMVCLCQSVVNGCLVVPRGEGRSRMDRTSEPSSQMGVSPDTGLAKVIFFGAAAYRPRLSGTTH